MKKGFEEFEAKFPPVFLCKNCGQPKESPRIQMLRGRPWWACPKSVKAKAKLEPLKNPGPEYLGEEAA